MDFNPAFSKIHTILKAASSKCRVLDEKFPSKFFERDPNKVFDSYRKFLRTRVDSEGNLKNEDKVPVTTVAQRLENGEYEIGKQNGFYRLYHDIRLVCTILVHFYSQGTRNYLIVDKFYKFATELLLRECYRLGVSFLNEQSDSSGTKTSFQHMVSNDFIKISVGYSMPYAENYHINTADMDLFSSIISKSQLDYRVTDLPNSSFTVNRLIPQDPEEEAPMLGFLAANTSSIPDPTLPPTEMMTKFLHPNWYALPTTVWLEYGDFQSWAPCFNESGTVLDASRRGTIWLEKVGYMKLLDSKKSKESQEQKINEESKISGGEKSEDESKDADANTKTEGEASTIPFESKEEADSLREPVAQDEPTQDGPESIPNEIKLENLFEWSPGRSVGENEIDAFRSGTQQQAINETLLELNELKKARLKWQRIKKPSSRECMLYHKVQRLMREAILAGNIKKIPQLHCKSFPVLQTNYTGNIPVIRSVQTRKKKYRR
ncbi:LAMI_0G00144g1_1 [Lachancea mirantina]|uniref:LAMI_0G00144g1_1 n=1 Tax=Lachancea mirantina TaxID=1230905 RepID=A0A1G4K703_9SACH|nr:LAMI_0G00144g1_1 [Lachancea mirantina]